MGKRKRPPAFVKPADPTVFWIAPHCGPGSTDPSDRCGFCGEKYIDCALACTAAANAGLVVTGNGDVDERANVCGGSGFWCNGCKRFWAQDSCGESDGLEHRCADGSKLTAVNGRAACPCGRLLMKLVKEDE
jgi:hypothetical protein